MRRLTVRDIFSRKVSHTLVVIGSIGDKMVYLDVPLEEAKARYVEANSNTRATHLCIEAAEVLTIADEFGSHNIWASPNRRRVRTQPATAKAATRSRSE